MAEKDDMTAIKDELAIIRRAIIEGSMQSAKHVWLLMEYDAGRKSLGAAYLLLMLTGWVGGHRFYLGKYITAVVILCLSGIPVSFVLGLLGADYGVWGFLEAEVGFRFEDVKTIAPIVVAVLIHDLFRMAGLVSEENLRLFHLIQARHFEFMDEMRDQAKVLEVRQRDQDD